MQKRKRDIFHRRRQKGYVEGENQTPLVAMLFFCSYCLKKKKVATCNVKFGPLLSDVGLSSETLTWHWKLFNGLNSGGGAFLFFAGVDGRRIFGWHARCTTIYTIYYHISTMSIHVPHCLYPFITILTTILTTMSYRCFVPFWGVEIHCGSPGLRGVGNILAALRQLLDVDVNQSTRSVDEIII